ncbi:hypothetical protein Bbelb_062740 [Branchiostoma belcheri]|nr:hypothetical protein Bbelb_062740 [Branchiostoma belcheri]
MHGKRHFSPSVVAVLLGAVRLCLAANCVKTGPCSCRMDDGSGVIDLSPLVKGSPTYKDMRSYYIPDTWVYSYNPCVPFSEGSCKNVSVCARNRLHHSKYESYGTQESAVFKSDTDVGLVLGYVDSPTLRVGAVELWCVEKNQPQNLTVVGRMPMWPNTIIMALFSPCCCPGAGPNCADSTTT